MKAIRFGTVQKVSTIVPLALVSAAWTAGLTGIGTATTAADSQLPDGASVPTQALEDPANFNVPGQLGLGVPTNRASDVVAAASTNGIPSAALAAYQRAETVINAADKACNIDWQLIAAIGRVESDHGRYGGNTLGTDGISRPGIYGIALNGTQNTQAISDTDAGQYDNDTVWDRAVGPMQFIPSTWSVVGVDADGDGNRDPQDIDDAALASAVYLCSGSDDLGTDAGRRASVFRYNHSEAYVDLVLRIREAYLQGDYTTVPNYTASAITFTPDYSYTPPKSVTFTPKGSGGKKTGGTNTGSSGGGGGTNTGGGGGGTNTGGGGTNTGGGGGGDDDDDGVLGGGDSDDPIKELTEEVEKTTKKAADPVGEVVEDTTEVVVSLAEAEQICSEQYNKLTQPVAYLNCLATYGY